MSLFDLSTPNGRRADERLRQELVIWLSTVSDDGIPQTSPVWSVWDGDEFLIYSRPGQAKVSNVEARPGVSLHLDGDGRGGAIVTVEGHARVEPDHPGADEVPAYVAKYEDGFRRLGTDPVGFAADYSVAIRVRPVRARAWGNA